ncbi:hypothetical protein [Methylotenera sp.]|uniref:hypothetical protein n=1 Tax=Methylotenera sp. TaxID=2051956 RepID=UPI00273357EA|nr:hypothetical protein [Methylotenera sp.]MDP3210398.1 hypothetical protein [Methylotenera sp.]
MNNKILIWEPKHIRDARKNLDEFINFAKNELTIYSNQKDDHGNGWGAGKWKTIHTKKSTTMVFGFSTNAYKINELFKNPFMDFSKAFIRQEQTIYEASSVSDWIAVFRLIYRALETANLNNSPSILDLNANVQTLIGNSLRLLDVTEAKKYHYGAKLEKLYKWLSDKRILINLPVWRNPHRKQKNKVERLDEESIKWREERCPSMHQMLSIADCFARAESVKDQYITSVLVLLCFAPGRAHEVNSLTIHSLQKDDDGQYFVSWHAGKGFGDTRKMVPYLMVDIVKQAFGRLIKIGEHARKAARFAYENPGIYMLDDESVSEKGFPQDKPLSPIQFAKAMSISHKNSRGKEFTWETFPQLWIKQLIKTGVPTYSSLSLHVLESYKNKEWPKNPLTDRPVWENLCLIRENELHDEFPAKNFSWQNINVNQINDQLGKRTKSIKTLWERFGIKDENGEEIELSSHQLRVWLNTHAYNGGMNDYIIAIWSGRADSSQNKAYDARTKEEKERVKNMLMSFDLKKAPSPLELYSVNMPVSLKGLGINRDGVADFTGLGFCVHNYAQTPCTKAGECITCKEHVCIKGLPDTLENLEEMELLISEQLERAKKENEDLTFGADRWVTHFGWKLAHIRALIYKLKDPAIENGALIRIPIEHDPSPTRRALMSKGHKTQFENNSEKTVEIKNIVKSLGLF